MLQQLAERISPRVLHASRDALVQTRRQLDEYFEHDRRRFEIPLDWRLTSGFRRAVLRATEQIPYGQTASYRDVATRAGSPNAVRAAGSALATNPIPIVVPCHRVAAQRRWARPVSRRPGCQGPAARSRGSGMSDRWDIYDSPLGGLTLTTGECGLTGIAFPRAACSLDEDARDPAALAPVAEQLDQYFAGERRRFDLALALTGSAFQTRIWERLLEIPYGTTMTYGELALAVGRPDIVRGVAAAVGRTPIPIVIPCHRVLGAGGALTGYGGGLHRKRALLGLERRGPAALGVMAECGHRQLTLL